VVEKTQYKSDSSTVVAEAIRSFETQRDLVTVVENKWGASTSLSKYTHRYDALGRRTDVVMTGTAFPNDHLKLFTYNDRSEMLTSKRYGGTDPDNPGSPATGQHYTFNFDPIGNRLDYTGENPPVTTTYTANTLNQYTATASPSESFVYDFDGNMTQDASADYTWDAENRLTTVVPRAPSAASKKLVFTYDYMGRRVRKQVYDWISSAWSLSKDTKFVYDGWNLLLELNGLSSDAVLRKYTWGLDLSGQGGNASPAGIHAAGGIGGLLSMNDAGSSTNHWYFYNANGDIGQLVDSSSGNFSAKYQYYPYGGEIQAVGTYATTNPFRFSTKYWDAEQQAYYYGYRYHKSKLGRWLSRDPLAETGGFDLYVHTANAPTNLVDPDGLLLWPPRAPNPPVANPPIDPTVPIRNYNCGGLAFRNYDYLGEDAVETVLSGFRQLGSCDDQCKPCEIKCWFWQYIIRIVDGHGRTISTHPDFHIVCGECSIDGEDPSDVYGKNGPGPIVGPSPGGSHRPPGEETLRGIPLRPEQMRIKRRENMKETCWCTPISGLP